MRQIFFSLPVLGALTCVAVACGGGNASEKGGSDAGGGGASAQAGGTGSGGDAGPRPVDPSPVVRDCGAYRPGLDLEVCAASYVGTSGDDRVVGVGIQPDGTVVLGVSVAVAGKADADLGHAAGPSRGEVLRLSPEGRKVLSRTLLGSAISDFAVNPSGMIAVGTPEGVFALSEDALKEAWSDTSPRGSSAGPNVGNVAIGWDGSIATEQNGQVDVYDATGKAISSFASSMGAEHDLALDSSNKLVFTAGERQDDGGACSQLRVPHLRAFSLNGSPTWTGWDGSDALYSPKGLCADSVGRYVSIGLDGKLYFVGDAHGGNTVFDTEPTDLDTGSPPVCIDEYSSGAGGAAKLMYVMRLDPVTGKKEAAAKHLARNPDDPGGKTVFSGPVTADEYGNAIVAGFADCCVNDEKEQTVMGTSVWQGGGPFLLILGPNFHIRATWNVLGYGAWPTSVATRSGAIVWGGEESAKDYADGWRMFEYANAFEHAGGAEGWFGVFPGPTSTIKPSSPEPATLRTQDGSTAFCPFIGDNTYDDLGCSHYCACWSSLCAADYPGYALSQTECENFCRDSFSRGDLEAKFSALNNPPAGSHCGEAVPTILCR